MRYTLIALVLFFVCLSGISLAADTAKSDQVVCPRTITVEVLIKTTGAVSGWEAIPAKSTFTLTAKESVVRNNSLICHYTNGTVDYNIARAFPKGKNCFLAPNQSFMCQGK